MTSYNQSPDVVWYVDEGATGPEPFRRALANVNGNKKLDFRTGGTEAARDLCKAPGGNGCEWPKPDLIVLDNLPPCKLFDVLQNLRANVNTRGMPVIVLMSSPRLDYRRRAWDLGATGYIVKTKAFAQETAEIAEHFLAPRGPDAVGASLAG